MKSQIEKEKIIKPNFEKLIFNDAITISLAYVDKILKEHPELDYIINNIDSIRKEINLWRFQNLKSFSQTKLSAG